MGINLWHLHVMSRQTQGQDILFSSPEEDSSLYFTYSGGRNEVEVRNLNYEVSLFRLYSFSVFNKLLHKIQFSSAEVLFRFIHLEILQGSKTKNICIRP